MCARLDAVRDVARKARELAAACACSQAYGAIALEPIPDDMKALLDKLPALPRGRRD